MVRPRMLLVALACSAALLGLGACTSTVAGTATFAGPTQTSETSETSTEETTEETSTAETSDPPLGDPDELFACITVSFAYTTAITNFNALADATTNGTPTTLTRETVAADLDSAIASVQPSLDPLPAGPIRDAIQSAQTAAGALRDGLRAGADVSNSDLLAAVDSISTECEF